jgi:hypothetical protein
MATWFANRYAGQNEESVPVVLPDSGRRRAERGTQIPAAPPRGRLRTHRDTRGRPLACFHADRERS